ncbi:TadE/TadG family type IV pilus assembly protein [Streptomyces sp. KR80]|uniref:TadE/TadG family type IV pilus assembly protein n=1 Tax=Streptomyces sp. KR80 TaxID=3457426 RepID=UPI003FD45E8B
MRAQPLGGDRGQVAVEFVGMLPVILATVIMVWQAVLLGYTYTLAGNAADQAAHEAAKVPYWQRASECEQAARHGLADPDWQNSGFTAGCDTANGLVTATVDVPVPVLFPGFVNFPFSVTGDAGSPVED